MSAEFVDRFGAVSDDYSKFRPKYPSAIFDWLASIAPSSSLVWDCATGSGQAAVELTARFDRVVATDASPAQIASAVSAPGLTYRVAEASDSGLADQSVDLITVAQALHWFDLDAFFAECERVLVPGGVLAVWSYGPLSVDGKTVDAVIQRYYHDIVGPWWPPERVLVDSGYASIELPGRGIETPPFEMEAWWTLNQTMGYLSTWSASSAYRSAMGEDPLVVIENSLGRAWRDPEGERRVRWPLTLRACRSA